MPTSPKSILQDLETLPYAGRIRRMIELGREAGSNPASAAVLEELSKGGFYERFMALHSCFGSRDGSMAVRALDDPSRQIRGLALTLITIVGSDTDVGTALHTSQPRALAALLRRLFKLKRSAPIDAFLETLAVRNDERLAVFLAFGSAGAVARHSSRALPLARASDWKRLARLHPDVALDALMARAEAAENLDLRLLDHANAALHYLTESRPERAIELIRFLLKHASLPQLSPSLPRLTRRAPEVVADLVLQSPDPVAAGFERVAHRLGLDRLLPLVQRRSLTVSASQVYLMNMPAAWLRTAGIQSSTWFRHISVENRRALYVACSEGWRDGRGCMDASVVALLPRALREREGHRHLNLPALAAQPMEQIPYAQFLLWEEAREFLRPFVGHPTPALRVAAWTSLIGAVRFHRDRLPEVLDRIESRKNEQDPVRSAMLAGLADLPPGIWKQERLDQLETILRQALSAADLSHATASHLERLVITLLPLYPDPCASWLAMIVQDRGRINYGNFEARLSDGDVQRLAPYLLLVLQSWETREREPQLVVLANALGKRVRVFNDLMDILERVLQETKNAAVAEGALRLIGERRHFRLASLIPALIGRDKSWATRRDVYMYLHDYRQDLLTPYLGQQAYKGRFSTGRTRFVLPLQDGFYRWTSSQQALFAKTLEAVIRDEKRDTPAKYRAITPLAALPDISPDVLFWLARVDEPTTALRDAALRALGTLDAGEGIPTLIEALGDDRGRVAIYALRTALIEMQPERAVELLVAAPLERVTIAKEVVRLLGDLQDETAYRRLLQLDAQDLHRDVRVALLRALWSHPDRPETWDILERAAVSSDPAVAGSLAHMTTQSLSPRAEVEWVGLFRLLLIHPDSSVRLDALRRCASLPVADREKALLQPLLRALESRISAESAAAAAAIFRTYPGREAGSVGDAIRRILPHRRNLKTAVDQLNVAARFSREHLLPTVREVLSALQIDPLTIHLQIWLAVHSLPWEEVGLALERAVVSGDLHGEALMVATAAIGGAVSRPDASGMEILESTFQDSPDERLRRLALAALTALSGPSRGWTAERLERLQPYRQDLSPMVASAAQFTLPVEEE